jgi:ATP-dependent helicase/nuclease subunit A
VSDTASSSEASARLLEEDARARRRALDPRGSFLVQAPAGSGKTTLLAARYLALLANVEHPEEIVALTFTRKAAGEMGQRVLDALAAESGREGGGGGELRELARRALDHARRCGWDEAELPLRLRIHTIDQLALGIVRRLPQRAAAGALLSPTEEAGAMYHAAARLLLEDLETGGETARAVRMLLLHLDDPDRFLRLVERMLARREQWLPLLAESAERGRVEDRWRAHLEACCAAAGDPPGGRAEAASWLDGLGAPAGSGLEARLERLRLLAKSLLKKEGDWRARGGTVLNRLGITADAPDYKEWLAAWQRLRRAFVTEGDPPPPWLLEILRLPDPGLRDEEWELLRALIVVLARGVEHLSLVFRRERRVDFVEITRLAYEALGEDEAPTDLQLALDYRIRHLLVDEFQDTSLSHYAFLARLVRGWSPEDGRSFFAVGDPMQSIYRFRQADVAVFLEVRRRGRLGDLPLEPLVLHRNFRSDPALVDWVNRFRRVFPAADDPARGAVRFVPAVAARPRDPTAGVRVHAVDPAEEAARLAEILAGPEAAYGRRAILLRTRTQAEAIVTALRARGVRPRLVDIVALAAVPAVEDLLALSEALLHPGDGRAWLAVLRAPWCGLGNPALAALAQGPDPPGVRLLSEGPPSAEFKDEEAARLARVVPLLARGVETVARHGPRRGVEAAWVSLGGPALLETEGELRAAERFLALLEEPGLVDLWRLDPELFEQRVRALYAPEEPAAENAVEILTVHGAKGLEWDHVFLPALGRKTHALDRDLLAWQETLGRRGERLLLVAPRSAPSSRGSPSPPTAYEYLHGLEEDRERAETVRLAYVAATRARSRLDLFLPSARADENGHAPSLARVFAKLVDGPPAAPPRSSTPTRSEPAMRPERTRLASLFAFPGPSPEAQTDEEGMEERDGVEAEPGGESRIVGRVLHAVLARWADRSDLPPGDRAARDERDAVRSALRAAGLVGSALDDAAAEVEAALRGVLASRRGRWILAPHDEARTEWAVEWVDVAGEVRRLRLDRTFRDRRGRRWIVDYKLGRHEGGEREAFLDAECLRHRPQLETYARALRALGASGPMFLGLYFPLLRAWRSWPAAEDPPSSDESR